MKYLKALLLIGTVIAAPMASYARDVHTLLSPDGGIRVDVTLSGGISYDVFCSDELVLDDCRLCMDVEGVVLGSSPEVRNGGYAAVLE